MGPGSGSCWKTLLFWKRFRLPCPGPLPPYQEGRSAIPRGGQVGRLDWKVRRRSGGLRTGAACYTTTTAHSTPPARAGATCRGDQRSRRRWADPLPFGERARAPDGQRAQRGRPCLCYGNGNHDDHVRRDHSRQADQSMDPARVPNSRTARPIRQQQGGPPRVQAFGRGLGAHAMRAVGAGSYSRGMQRKKRGAIPYRFHTGCHARAGHLEHGGGSGCGFWRPGANCSIRAQRSLAFSLPRQGARLSQDCSHLGALGLADHDPGRPLGQIGQWRKVV